MGGIGSGQRHQSGRRATGDQRTLDIRWLNKRDLLRPGLFFSLDWTRNQCRLASIQVQVEVDKLVLSYRHQRGGGEWHSMEYPVAFDWTRCNYGGRRAWFTCPAQGCGRRVAVLYLGGCGVFACRHCYRLAYSSQREAVADRAARRADRIRERLGWPAGILNRSGSKPKGMHWKTYWRLRSQHDAFVGLSLNGMTERLKRWIGAP